VYVVYRAGAMRIFQKKDEATLFPTFDMRYSKITPKEFADVYGLNN
jgi:hypothetical protein